MKTLITTLAATLVSSQAFAHITSTPHAHPHAVDGAMFDIGVVVVFAALVAAFGATYLLDGGLVERIRNRRR